jgi:hypothetical protein
VESLSQVGLGIITVVLAVICTIPILLVGVLVVVIRSGVLGDLFRGVGAALHGEDAAEHQAQYVVREVRSRRLERPGVSEIRARLDDEFEAQISDPAVVPPTAQHGAQPLDAAVPAWDSEVDESADDDARRRRRRSAGAYEEDELDAFLDDAEL